MIEAEGIGRIDQHDVKRPRDAPVLKAVVQEKDADARLFRECGRRSGGAIWVRLYDDFLQVIMIQDSIEQELLIIRLRYR